MSLKLKKRSGKKAWMLLVMSLLIAAVPITASAASDSTAYAKLNFSNNKYYIFNNSWGSSSVSGWSQSVYVNSNTDLGYVWNWPTTSGGVKAYPSLVSGWHWTEGYTPGSGLPTRLSANKSINTGVGYSKASNTNGEYNNAYDIWLHDIGNATWSSTPTEEIMIWNEWTSGVGPIGSKVFTDVSIGGQTYDLYRGEITDNGVHQWWVYSFLKKSQSPNNFSINVKNFTDYLISKSYFTNSKYVSSVEYGTEITKGSGQINYSNWYVNVQ
ncbi:glycoside hydrolase [Paenibacillus sp. F6_3S_P_1C]|uniref:Glycoside hydrolase n=1 Tax=Paenibacillus vandeheii TaxID=3035917 RepID=A0ABT8JE69_9BACL|nr:glycoside hydrolase [Paenibacillus vandeheii]MDN4603330.1 glycoside hydrolase [Paenibacillus vandeheii]